MPSFNNKGFSMAIINGCERFVSMKQFFGLLDDKLLKCYLNPTQLYLTSSSVICEADKPIQLCLSKNSDVMFIVNDGNKVPLSQNDVCNILDGYGELKIYRIGKLENILKQLEKI